MTEHYERSAEFERIKEKVEARIKRYCGFSGEPGSDAREGGPGGPRVGGFPGRLA